MLFVKVHYCGLGKHFKPTDEFSASGLNRNGCRGCRRESEREYKKLYRKENEANIKAYAKTYNAIPEIKKIKKSYNISYREENKEDLKECRKKYVLINKEKVNKLGRDWCAAKKKSDPSFKLKTNVGKHISITLKRSSIPKKGSSWDHLSFTPDILKAHLESKFEEWMNWENWKVYNSKTWDDNDKSTWTWHIDHIVPQSEFKFKSMEDEDFKKCWSLDNLRPYNAKMNVMDGVNRTRHSKKENKK